MKDTPSLYLPFGSAETRFSAFFFLVAALFAFASTARAQTIFVADPNGTNGVSSYNIDGTLISAAAIPGTTYEGLALSGSTLFVASPGNGTGSDAKILKDTIDGTGAVSSTGYLAFGGGASGLLAPYGLLATSTNVYVADFNSGNVFKYDYSGTQLANISTGNSNGGYPANPYGLAISGDTLWVSQATTGNGVNTIKGYSLTTFSSTPTLTITTDLNLPHGLAISGNTMFVANGGDGTIWTFNATTGAPIIQLVSGLTNPQGVTFYGSAIYVSGSDGTVKGFDATTGAPLAGFTTITGLSSPYGIAVSAATAVPEPSTYAAIAGAAALGFVMLRRRRAGPSQV